MRTAQAASPWHRKRLGHVDADSLDEATLAELPVMTKDDLMANFDEIVTDDRLRLDVVEDHLARLGDDDAYLFDRYHAAASSGSSGRRGVFVYDWDAWTTFYLGTYRATMRELAGWAKPRPPLLALVAASNATHLSTPAHRPSPRPR